MTLLSLLAAALGSWVSFTLNVTGRLEKQMRVYDAVAGGIRYASVLVRLDPTPTSDGPQEDWAQMRDWASSLSGDVQVDVGPGMVDEARKLNLNSAPVDLLVRFFIGVGVEVEQARIIADSIADWRDEDDKEHSNGAEGFYYHALDAGYDCKNGPFESVEELLFVRGMTPEIWQKAAPYLTAYGKGVVNLNTADRLVLQALGITAPAVDVILSYRVGEDDKPGTPDDRVFESVDQMVLEIDKLLPLEDRNRLSQLSADGVVGFRTETFSLSITGVEGTEQSRMSVWCVLDRAGRILDWRER